RARLREAAAVLGAPPRRVWREVDLPMVSRAAAAGAGFAFAVSLGEFGATAFVARPDSPTMPLAIFRFLGQPGALNFGRAMAMSVILMVVTAAAVALIDRFRPAGLGDF
nr:ABC transporter permease subunit [Acidimicrobiia bacterium]